MRNRINRRKLQRKPLKNRRCSLIIRLHLIRLQNSTATEQQHFIPSLTVSSRTWRRLLTSSPPPRHHESPSCPGLLQVHLKWEGLFRRAVRTPATRRRQTGPFSAFSIVTFFFFCGTNGHRLCTSGIFRFYPSSSVVFFLFSLISN